VKPQEIGLLRLAALRLAGPGLPDPAEAVRWLGALQAQDGGAPISVALRTTEKALSQVDEAFAAGEIVKSWPLRGTLHLTAAEDLPWMLQLSTPRSLVGVEKRRAFLGLDESTLEKARELAIGALTGGGALLRDELYGVWSSGGAPSDAGRGYHMLWYLSQTGTLVFGPPRDGEQQVVLLEEWTPRPRHLERDEALGELALRYFRSHGPATVKDFTGWCKLLAADVRVGVALARPYLEAVVVEGIEYLMDPATPELLASARADARGVHLLPGFDEFVLGYQDRSAILAPEFARAIVPGGNGIFRPTVIANGQIIGTWRHKGQGAKRRLDATSFTAFTPTVERALASRYDGLPGAMLMSSKG
jgi:hypothetical protein